MKDLLHPAPHGGVRTGKSQDSPEESGLHMNRFFLLKLKKPIAGRAEINCQDQSLAQAGRGRLVLAGALVKIMKICQNPLKQI